MELAWYILGTSTGYDLRLFGMRRGFPSGERDIRALVGVLTGTVDGGGNRRSWTHVRSVGWMGEVVGGRPRRLV